MAQHVRKSVMIIFVLLLTGFIFLQQPVSEYISHAIWESVKYEVAEKITVSFDGRTDPEPYDTLIFYVTVYAYAITCVLIYGLLDFMISLVFRNTDYSFQALAMSVFTNLIKSLFILTLFLMILYFIPSDVGESAEYARPIMMAILLLDGIVTIILYRLTILLFTRLHKR